MPATLSQIRAWSTEHLIDAACYWNRTADRWEDAFLTMRNQSHAIAWRGAGGEGLRQRIRADLPLVSAKADQLRQAAGIARNGASEISAAQRRALYAVEDAHSAGFTVGEGLSVADTRGSGTPAEQAARQAQAQAFAADIRLRAEQLDRAEVNVAGQLTAAAGDVGNVSFVPAASDHHGAVQLVDDRFKESPAPPPTGPKAADIRKVLEQLPKGSTDDIREVHSPEDLQNLQKWMTQDGADGFNRYRDPTKGAWKDLPDGSKVGERFAASSTGKSALDIDLQSPDGTEHWKVHINPQTGGEPNIPAPKAVPVEQEPEAPKATPPQAGPVEPARPAPPIEATPAPKPAPPAAKIPIGGWGGPSAEPFGPQPIHPPGSINHRFPILGEDNPAESPRDFEGH